MNTTRKLSYIFNVYGAVTGRSFDSLGEFDGTILKRARRQYFRNEQEIFKKKLRENISGIFH